MGALRKIISTKTGKASWQIDYLEPPDENGNRNRVRKTFKLKKDAQAELEKRGTLIREKRYLDVKKEYTTTLKDLGMPTNEISDTNQVGLIKPGI